MKLKMKMQPGYEDLKPIYATKGAIAFDCKAAVSNGFWIPSGQVREVPLGFKMEVPEGYGAFLYARSGLGIKSITPANAVGLLDNDFRGEVRAFIHNGSNNHFRVERGDRIVQIVIAPIVKAEIDFTEDELSETERNEGGFGSTGTK